MSLLEFVIEWVIEQDSFDIPVFTKAPYYLLKGRLVNVVNEHNEMVRATRLEF
jgi:hypothetical protein